MLSGSLFSEPVRVETVRANGADSVEAGLVGQRTERFRRVTLTSDDIANLTIADPSLSYDGDGRLLRLGLQAYTLGIAYEFDPYFGLSISRVDPLPTSLRRSMSTSSSSPASGSYWPTTPAPARPSWPVCSSGTVPR